MGSTVSELQVHSTMLRYLDVNKGVGWVAKSDHGGLGFNMGANMKWIVFGNLTSPGWLHNVHADSDSKYLSQET